MQINTKYNIGDEVYALFNNKVKNFIITGISIVAKEKFPILIRYISFNIITGEYMKIDEKEIFPTKEELLKSL